MKFILLFALFATVLSVPLDSEWTSFKTKFNKTYKDVGEEVQRYQIFTRNMKKVNEHNERAKNGLHSYTLGMNKFADLTSEEFSKTHLGFKNNQKISAPRLHQKGDVSALPESVDWRKKGIVTKVKDQGNCGSCWAFSAVASMEGAHAQATGKLVELSEQNLVDCSGPEGDYGCEGGLMDYAFNYTIVNGGIDTEDSYPYIGRDEACQFKKSSIGMTIKSFTNIPTNDEDALVDAVAQRVVSVAIDAAGFDFQMYQGGVYTESCGPNPQLNHGVTVVGYGDDTGEDYWLVKNSWGSDWGESGYIRMFRGINICGIAAEASYPDV